MVCPAAMVTVAGEIVSLAGLMLARETVTALAAGADKEMGKLAEAPKPTLTLEGRLIDAGAVTVMFAVAFGILGLSDVAVIVAPP